MSAVQKNNNENALVPIITETEHEQHDINQMRFEALNVLERDFNKFQCEVRRQIEKYHEALRMVTCDMYKEIFKILDGKHVTGLASDYIACEQVKYGMHDMHNAFYQAKAYCLILPR